MTEQSSKQETQHESAGGDGRPTRGARMHLLLTPAPDVVSLCRSQLNKGDTVVLLDRGVELSAELSAGLAWLGDTHCRVADSDLQARGLAMPDAYTGITDAQLVQAVLDHRHTLSWS